MTVFFCPVKFGFYWKLHLKPELDRKKKHDAKKKHDRKKNSMQKKVTSNKNRTVVFCNENQKRP